MSAPSSTGLVHDALLTHESSLIIDRTRSAANAELGKKNSSQDPPLNIRTGVKGPSAANWLSNLGLPLPNAPNSWIPLPQGGLIARLGQSEYLIDGDAVTVAKIASAARGPGVYPVQRQDATFMLSGSRVNELLLQTCNVDFRVLDADPSKLILTSMVGVSVTVLSVKSGDQTGYRIWCDGTYGSYLKATLTGIIVEIEGGVHLQALQ